MLNINSQFYQCDLNIFVLLCFSLKTLKRWHLLKKVMKLFFFEKTALREFAMITYIR